MSMNAVPSGPPEPDNKRAPVAGGGGPPYDGGMDRRLTVLETRFDTILPTLATKADLVDLRLDMEKMRSELLGKTDALGSELRGKIDAVGSELRGEMSELGSSLRAEMVKLRNEVHGTLMKAMMWFGALAITVIFSIAGMGIYLSNQVTAQITNQISNLATRLQVPSAPSATPPDRQVPGALPPARR
ncbi:hypothetical protein F2P44_04450 [Massilia sp. CCM 8695]|uniref:DUF1640 domain-containing protein n=1 Tax=Massilia frigida TaxID=2609281 RepID=A0ABX0N5L8_9BURK|nr:hypothetical protein [Massilia frigida]NHZ78536.1 hypothetical protein [Massilia frigida]